MNQHLRQSTTINVQMMVSGLKVKEQSYIYFLLTKVKNIYLLAKLVKDKSKINIKMKNFLHATDWIGLLQSDIQYPGITCIVGRTEFWPCLGFS